MDTNEMGAYAQSDLQREEIRSITKKLTPLLSRLCKRFRIVGSFRRKQHIMGDLDILVSNCDMLSLAGDIDKYLDVTSVPRSGKSLLSVVINWNNRLVQVEFSNVPDDNFGAALIHSSSGAEFNMGIRSYAKKKGMLLNQYGLHDRDTGKTIVTGKSEEEIFTALGLKFIPTVDRNQNFWSLLNKYKNTTTVAGNLLKDLINNK